MPPPFRNACNLFIRRWGEMAATWGISRTMAELHALLYLSTEPLCTDDVMALLSISRGSASMNLRQLVNWGLIERVHRRGDRKEYFQAETDVWQMFETITRERKRREIEPIVETIQRCLAMIEQEKGQLKGEASKAADQFQKRFTDILKFFEMMNMMFNVVTQVGRSGLEPLASALTQLAPRPRRKRASLTTSA